MPERALIITGMHRSGTSLAANWLSACGLDIGHNLIGATPSNKLGHFEDKDVLEFHEQMLRFNEADMYAGKGVELRYNDYHVAKAKSLVFLRDQLSSEWGWKQPRAALFLSLWRDVLPSANYLFTYRRFKDTVDSLYNREFNKIGLRNPAAAAREMEARFIENKNDICRKYLSMWIRHNQDILDHIGKAPEKKSLLVSVEDIVAHSEHLLDYLIREWGFSLQHVHANTIYEASLLNRKPVLHDNPDLESEAGEIELELERINKRSIDSLNN